MAIPHAKKRSFLYILIALVLFIGFRYIYSSSKYFTTKTIAENYPKLILSPEQICYLPIDDTFRRNHLRRLVVETVYNRSAYSSKSDASILPFIPKNCSTLDAFIEGTRIAVLARRLISGHFMWTLFHNPPYKDMVRPSCDGLWMEFGVFRGTTLSLAANWKAAFCGNTSQPVYGFDTFKGLPTDWRPGFQRGAFDIPNGTVISVPSNTILVKGLFIDTLPTQLRLIDREYQCNTPVAFLHIDCDIYDGARDALFLLGNRLVPGSILVFDELFNYPGYEKHEIKALFELLSGSDLRLLPLGATGDILLHPTKEIFIQSFGFVVY